MVLLKNDGSALPLSKATATTSVAIIGPNGNATDTLLGNYEGVPQYKISVFEAMRREYPKCSFESGCDNVACMNTTNFADAATLASQSDVVVLVIGLDQTQESEGHDRTKISLPGEQEALINVVASASKNKFHIVVMGGGSVDLEAAVLVERLAAFCGQATLDSLAALRLQTLNWFKCAKWTPDSDVLPSIV